MRMPAIPYWITLSLCCAVFELGTQLSASAAAGDVIRWGSNAGGPLNVPANATNAVSVCAGRYHALALRADGTVVGWGDNSVGETTVPEDATNVVAIAAGGAHSLALRANGTVLVWGDDGP